MGTGPDAIAAANPGCVIQIAQHLERPLAVLHPIELLARSLRGER
jgi:glycolate oxidase iron-sulfur subunit